MELREKIIEILWALHDAGDGEGPIPADTAADRILAIPEIAEALECREVIVALNEMNDRRRAKASADAS